MHGEGEKMERDEHDPPHSPSTVVKNPLHAHAHSAASASNNRPLNHATLPLSLHEGKATANPKSNAAPSSSSSSSSSSLSSARAGSASPQRGSENNNQNSKNNNSSSNGTPSKGIAATGGTKSNTNTPGAKGAQGANGKGAVPDLLVFPDGE